MNDSNRQVTIKEVARQAGVSVSTVSLALRNSPRIKPETRNRVQMLAREMGYRRNPAFAALGTRSHHHTDRTGIPIAVIRQKSATGYDYWNIEISEGIRGKCLDLGYRPEFILLDDYPSPDHFFRIAEAQGIAAIIFQFLKTSDILEHPSLKRLALAATGVYQHLLPVDTVRQSPFQRSRRAIHEVYRRGYRRILVFQLWHRDARMEDDVARESGILAASREIGDIENGWVRMVERPRRSEIENWRRLIDEHQPEVVIGFNNGDYWAVREAGYDIPGEIAFAAQEGEPDERDATSVALCRSHHREVGAAAVDWIDRLIQTGRLGIPLVPFEVVVSSPWQDGETLPDRN